MRIPLLILVMCGLCGCASFDRKALEEAGLWPSRTRDWCYPRVRYGRAAKRAEVGVRCHFQ